jgi:hypothetical protein
MWRIDVFFSQNGFRDNSYLIGVRDVVGVLMNHGYD